MLFATDEQLRMFFSAKTIMIDGTFSACVPHFNQVFSLHCIKYGYSKSIPNFLNTYLTVNYFSLKIFHVLSVCCLVELLQFTSMSSRYWMQQLNVLIANLIQTKSCPISSKLLSRQLLHM